MDDQTQSTSLHSMQSAVDTWISQWEEGYWHPMSNLARLVEEVGELAREINHRCGEKTPKDTEEPGSLTDEFGDVLFAVATLANSLGVDLDEAFAETMKKIGVRDAERFAPAE
jgi:NTP pyrophosphatase (non-canonical NTP hydrolase)